MTKGLVLVLGKCGRNFAAGMSGGIAYVFDDQADFTEKRCNLASVDLEPVVDTQDVQVIQKLLAEHVELTGSRRAKSILDNWNDMQGRFIKIFPHEFKRVLGVGRTRQQYIPGQQPPVEIGLELEQVQHG
jgi:glutamate synthase domain-containing protein 3